VRVSLVLLVTASAVVTSTTVTPTHVTPVTQSLDARMALVAGRITLVTVDRDGPLLIAMWKSMNVDRVLVTLVEQSTAKISSTILNAIVNQVSVVGFVTQTLTTVYRTAVLMAAHASTK